MDRRTSAGVHPENNGPYFRHSHPLRLSSGVGSRSCITGFGMNRIAIKKGQFSLGSPPAGFEQKAGTRVSRDPIDREDLVSPRPLDARELAAGFQANGVHAAAAAVAIEPGRVAGETRNDA